MAFPLLFYLCLPYSLAYIQLVGRSRSLRFACDACLARQYTVLSAEDASRCNCAALEETLGLVPDAQRMVVGHTIQEAGINSACGNKVFRIDVGLSAGCGDGEPQVIIKDT